MSDQMQSFEVDDGRDEATHSNNRTVHEEVKFYFRFLRCILVVTAAWFVFLLCMYLPKDRTMDGATELLMLLMGSVIALAALLVCCCAPQDLSYRDVGRRQTLSGEGSERSELVAEDGNSIDDTDMPLAGFDTDESTDDFPFSFAETAIRIRQAGLDDVFRDEHDPVDTSSSYAERQPLDGVYRIVCTAVYFGKTVRSEGRMELYFTADRVSSSGWDVQGTQKFQASSRPLIDGFLNRNGQFYWIVAMPQMGHCIYRGMFDFNSNAVHDGDFKSKTGPKGRIVRVERIGDVSASS